MPRSEKHRIVHEPLKFTGFKPMGVAGRFSGRINLLLEEFEAFRLADSVDLSHAEAYDEMEISRSTFTRLIEKVRKQIADFIIHGKLFAIDGGNILFRNNIIRCYDCGHMFNINIKTLFTKCPECKSTNLINLAGGLGHGRCCIIS